MEKKVIESCEVTPESVGMSSKKLNNLYGLIERYVDEGKLPGAICMVVRDGKLVHESVHGNMDDEAGRVMTKDAIFRIYSMTKPIASIALMQLYESGLFQLDDPVSRFIPELANLKVLKASKRIETESMREPQREMTVRDLLMHTSGLVATSSKWRIVEGTRVGGLYREANLYSGANLSSMVKVLGTLPLHCDPGSEWNYGISTDIVGYLCEVLSGESFEQYLQKYIFNPLRMFDTGFSVDPINAERLCACYRVGVNGSKYYELEDSPQKSRFLRPTTYFSGSGGLVSTAKDYLEFCKMLAAGGALNGERIIGSRTLDYMTVNHLPENRDLAAMGQPQFAETTMEGIGFGLGFAVLLDPTAAQVIGTPGEFYWGGMASTAFFISPDEDMAVLFLTQLVPSGSHPIRRQLRAAAYGAITD